MGRKIDRALKWKKSTRSSPPPHRCPVDLEFNAVASPSECRPLYYHRLSGLRCGKLGQLTQVTESRSSFSGPAVGDYVNVGVNTISVVDANSFWVDGYFEETNLARIRVGDPAQIKLIWMAASQTIGAFNRSLGPGEGAAAHRFSIVCRQVENFSAATCSALSQVDWGRAGIAPRQPFRRFQIRLKSPAAARVSAA